MNKINRRQFLGLLGAGAATAKLPQPGPAAPAQELDEETKKALESLGYVE